MTLPPQHFILNVNDDLSASWEMRMRRWWLFQFIKSSRTALLIHHLLLLETLHLKSCLVSLIVNTSENENVEYEETTADSNCDTQSSWVSRVSEEKNPRYVVLLMIFPFFDWSIIMIVQKMGNLIKGNLFSNNWHIVGLQALDTFLISLTVLQFWQSCDWLTLQHLNSPKCLC